MTLIGSVSGTNYELKLYQNLEDRLVKDLIKDVGEVVQTDFEVAAQWLPEKSVWTLTFQWDAIADIYSDPPTVNHYSHTELATVQELKNANTSAGVNLLAARISSIINQTLPDDHGNP